MKRATELAPRFFVYVRMILIFTSVHCGSQDAARLLETTYGIGHELAMRDAANWVEALRGCKIIE